MSVFPLLTQSFWEFTVFHRVVSIFLNAEAQRKLVDDKRAQRWQSHMERAQRPASWRLNKVIMSVFPLSTQSFGEFTVFHRVVSTFLNAEAQRMKSCYKTRGHRGGKATWRGHRDLRVEDSTKSLCQYFLF